MLNKITKLATYITFTASILCCMVPYNNSNIDTRLSEDPFFGFKSLEAPRTDLEIGANWKQDVGPLNEGIGKESIRVSSSYKEGDINLSRNIKNNIKLSILNYFGFSNYSEADIDKWIHLEGMEIVRVANINKLKIITDSLYIWEGLLLKDFSILVTKKNLNNFQATAKAKISGVNISLDDADRDNTIFSVVNLKGANLFVGYRVIQLANAVSVKVSSKTWSGDCTFNSEVGNDCYIRFDKIQDDEDIEEYEEPKREDSVCKYKMIITLNNVLDENGQPIKKKWRMPKREFNNGEYLLGTWIKSQGIVTDSIRISGFLWHYEPCGWNQYGVVTCLNGIKARFELVRRTYPIQTLKDPYASGW